MTKHGKIKIQAKGRYGYFVLAYSDETGITFTPNRMWNLMKHAGFLIDHIIHAISHESLHIAIAERISIKASQKFDSIAVSEDDASPPHGIHTSHPFRSKR